MKNLILLLIFPLFTATTFAQNKEGADKLVSEGIAYHDKGDYEGAISRYDKALALDKNNVMALAEKAYSLVVLEKYEESIQYCQKAIETHPGETALKTVYITYGNALDGLKKTDESVKIYDDGIKQFPDFYMLYFNKGVTLASIRKADEAILCMQKAIVLNPKHPGSHNALARLLDEKDKDIPALLAYCRFLVLEPQEKRAEENLASMQEIIKSNVQKTGKNDISITLNAEEAEETTEGEKLNDFSTINLLLALTSAMDYEKKYKKETAVERFIRKFDTVCASLKEQKANNGGFYWEYYVPYFAEMKEKKLIETFAYIAFASSDNAEVAKWLDTHKDEINEFYNWSEAYKWEMD